MSDNTWTMSHISFSGDIITYLNSFLQLEKNLYAINQNNLTPEDFYKWLLHQNIRLEDKIRWTISHFCENEYNVAIKHEGKIACRAIKNLSLSIEKHLIKTSNDAKKDIGELEEIFNSSLNKPKTLLKNYASIENEFIEFITTNMTTNLNQDSSNKNWFKVGLKFADGTIQQLQKEGKSGVEIAKKLGNEKGYRPYITTTLGVKTNSDKNIYSCIKKMKYLKQHCEQNNISLCEDFQTHYNELIKD